MNPNTIYEGGNYALHIAASTGILPLVEWLIRKGADVWVFNHAGESPMDIAYAYKHKNICRFLQKKAAGDLKVMYQEFHNMTLQPVNHFKPLYNTSNFFS